MADYMAGEIHIGGKVRRSVVQALCTAITKSGASLEWGGSQCRLNTPDELLGARSGDANEPLLLKLYDDQARWGEFAELETFLREAWHRLLPLERREIRIRRRSRDFPA